MSDFLALPPRGLPWWYPTRPKLVILSLALVLAGAVSWGVWYATHCASGVRRIGGECVGVTDGGFVFSPDLTLVMEKIRQENRSVEQAGEPFVSIAYLVAIPRGADDLPLSEILRHEVQGAYLAQRRANAQNSQPLIRLLAANGGEGNEQWEPVVAQLLGGVGSDRLVAVAGLGRSLETTRQAIGELAEHGIPMIAARLTADDLRDIAGQDSVEGLVRVAPTNRDQARAAIAYLKRDPALGRALLIQDVNEDDLYAKTLGDAFKDEFPDDLHTLIEPVEEYDSSLPGVPNLFGRMMANICQQRPDVIYFAGRGSDLVAFVEALPRRPCPDILVRIITGDGGGFVAPAIRQRSEEGEGTRPQIGLSDNVALSYTALAHPAAWAAAPELFSSNPIAYLQGNFEEFPDGSLADGGAIVGHDAVAIAVTAIRSAAVQRDLAAAPLTPGDVSQQWNALHGLNAVPGASGWISLDSVGDPVDKAIPILALQPDGTVAFVALSAAGGTPFTPPM
ncbi:MAG: ABC transporter substrate-binding protein [Egibacteraceae bacterium]